MSEPLVSKVDTVCHLDFSLSHCRLLYINEFQLPQVECLLALVHRQQLPLNLTTELVTVKLNQKRREQLCAEATQPILLLDDKNKLSWLSNGLSVAPEWDKLQRRVVLSLIHI